MLGELLPTDANYTGDTGDSVLSVQYYRNKASEFQAMMNALNDARASLHDTLNTVLDDATMGDVVDSIQLQLQDMDNQRGYFAAAAEALNLASQGLNSAGVRFPVVNNTLGLAPLAIAGIVAGAVAAAAALIVWGKTWLDNTYAIQSQAQALAAASTPAVRDEIARQIARTGAAKDASNSPLADAASIIKWIALAGFGYFALKMFKDFQKG